jgi:selenocysteine lyase/cysteine desulfurase
MSADLRELVKKEYHHLGSTYFNTAYFGPSPYSAKQKVSRSLQKELDPSFYDYNTWMGISERMRALIAKVVGCSPDNITHASSSSDVIATIAAGFDFSPGDVVCSIDKDYPSNVLPWMRAAERRGIEFKLLSLGEEPVPTAEWLAKNLPAKTKIFDISHVSFDTGKKIDLISIGKLMRERGILFVVDVTQSLGGLALKSEELELIDVIACSTYKWLLGPYGTAFGYFSDRALQSISHNGGNWVVSPNSRVVYNLLDYTTETLPGARKFDRGQPSNMLANSCLEAGLEMLDEIGLSVVEEHNRDIRDHFLANFPKAKYQLITPREYMGNIVALKARNLESIVLERELKYRNIDVSVRQGNLRISFHVFNSTEQVEELISALDI